MQILVLLAAATAMLAAQSVSAHLDLYFPPGVWSIDEAVQETGAFCGGGNSSVVADSWFGIDPFVSLGGDTGDRVTIRVAINNSTTTAPTVLSPQDFPIVVARNVTIPQGGNVCINTTSVGSYQAGSLGVLYAQSTSSDGRNVSTCASFVYQPAYRLQDYPVEDNGAVLTNSNGSNMTYYQFYCQADAEGDLAVTEECVCHCHGTEGHCLGECSQADISESNAVCEASAAPSTGACSCECHGDHAHCSGTCAAGAEDTASAQCAANVTATATTTGSASGVVGSAAASPTATGAALALDPKTIVTTLFGLVAAGTLLL